MPKLVRPTSDNDRLQLLQRSLRAGIKDAEAGRPRLAPPTLTRLTKLTARFDGTLRAAVDAEAAWRAAAQQATGARAALEVEIRTIWQRTGKTILWITHSIEEALFLASHIVVMTARPGRTKAAFRSHFCNSSDPMIGATTEFAAAKREIFGLLRSESQAARDQEVTA